MSPWAAQMSVMPRYIRKKKTSKSCDCAKANTVMPATLVNVQPDRTYMEINKNLRSPAYMYNCG